MDLYQDQLLVKNQSKFGSWTFPRLEDPFERFSKEQNQNLNGVTLGKKDGLLAPESEIDGCKEQDPS